MASLEPEKQKQKQKEEEIEDLADLLYFNILPRLPVKTLLRFRSVSQDWKRKFDNDENFARAHLTIYRGPLSAIIRIDDLRVIRFLQLGENDRAAAAAAAAVDFHIENQFEEFLHMVGTSNGMTCFTTKVLDMTYSLWMTRKRQVIVLNHARRESLSIPTLHGHEVTYGFGYDSVTGNYKIVVLSDSDPTYCGVLTLGDGHQWREISSECPSLNVPIYQCHPTSLISGNHLYWVQANSVIETRFILPGEVKGILQFDLHKEVFRALDPPQTSPSLQFMKILVEVRGRPSLWYKDADYRRNQLYIYSMIFGENGHHTWMNQVISLVSIPRGVSYGMMNLVGSGSSNRILIQWLDPDGRYMFYNPHTQRVEHQTSAMEQMGETDESSYWDRAFLPVLLLDNPAESLLSLRSLAPQLEHSLGASYTSWSVDGPPHNC